MRSVILDTDIGTDVDDAMALAALFGSPEVELLAVTTVYGDTALRARLARRYGSLAGRSLRVHAGIDQPLSAKPVWWAGHEGTLHEHLDDEAFEAEPAVDLLVRTVSERPGEIDIVGIGPLTNIAAAILRDASFAGGVRHLWLMGGRFDGAETEHNLRSDVTAAQVVFGSGIPTTVSSLEVTQRLNFGDAELERIAAAGALGAALRRDIQQWWEFWNETWNVPHDPLTVLTMTRPGLFELSEPGRLSMDGEFSTFTPGADGTARLVTGMDAAVVAEEIVRAVVRGGVGG